MALKDILSNAKYADDMILNLPDGSDSSGWRDPVPSCR